MTGFYMKHNNRPILFKKEHLLRKQILPQKYVLKINNEINNITQKYMLKISNKSNSLEFSIC